MYREKQIGVVVPAFNEETLIRHTVETMPDFVDKIIVVDDCSTDKTSEVVQQLANSNPRIVFLKHKTNKGVGSAISSGYIWCRDNGIDISVVMAGDGQMDPDDLPNLLDPVVEDRTDYSKGNRLVTGEAWKKIPHARYLGNSVLTFMTKIASGYWHVTDSQTGYTALNKKAMHLLPLEEIYPRYGMPNDFLVTLNIYNMRVMDIPVKPVYHVGEKSGIKIKNVLFSLTFLLLRLYVRRMVQKYIIRDFHPLILFYLFGFLMMVMDGAFLVRLFVRWYEMGFVPQTTAIAVLFCSVIGIQCILFAMLFDMEANKELKGK